jgi:selenocysteine-specific elongation factor
MRNIILGTAGHIDHGKSTLVKALTGTDPDRLKEEKERGITIDLGFANLDYPEEDLTVGIVDVPGHERLIRNMLAGAGGIDMVLLVIAADEGIMPQSREHLDICQLLRIPSGLIALTKADLVDPDWLQLVTEEARDFVKGTFLEGADIIPVSAKTGQNLDFLKEKIKSLALSIKSPKPVGGLFRLPIDRVFTLKGFGTVVTGTAVSGRIKIDEPVEILATGISTRVRGIQTHGKAREEAVAGQRTALNLIGVEKDQLRRGDVVVTPGRFKPTSALDIKIELLKDAPPLKSRDKVHFHLGTSESVARVILYGPEELKAGESCYGQARLGEPVTAQVQDRFVIRRFSPLETIGGGSVLDPSPSRRKRKDTPDDLEAYEKAPLKEKLEEKIKRQGTQGMDRLALEGWIKAEVKEIGNSLKELEKEKRLIGIGDTFIHSSVFETFKENLLKRLKEFHKANPLKPGMGKEELRGELHLDARIFAGLLSLIGDVVIEKDLIRLKSFAPVLTGVDQGTKDKIIKELEAGGFQPPFKEDLAKTLSMDPKKLSDILKLLEKEGLIVRMTDSAYLTRPLYEKLVSLLKEFFSRKPELTVAEFRDLLGTSRKYALPFLEYLDTHKITLRVGDVRKFLLK